MLPIVNVILRSAVSYGDLTGDCFIKCSFFQVGRSWEMVHLC